MKKNKIIAALFVIGASVTAVGQAEVSEAELMEIGVLPSTIPVLKENASDSSLRPITPTERNPFADRSKNTQLAAVKETETEEMKIRMLIGNLKFGGMGNGSNGMKVLVGDLILRKGTLLPQVIPDQTEQLVVRELDSDMIELAFLEVPQYQGQPRVIVIPLNLTPTVEQILSGRKNEKYVIHRGRKEMMEEKDLADIIANRAGGGSLGPSSGIKLNVKPAKRDEKPPSPLVDLLRNYRMPGGTVGAGLGGTTASSSEPASTGQPVTGTPSAIPGNVSNASGDAPSPIDFSGFDVGGGAIEGIPVPPSQQTPFAPRPGAPKSSSPPSDDRPAFTN
jgi:hypothetical protein